MPPRIDNPVPIGSRNLLLSASGVTIQRLPTSDMPPAIVCLLRCRLPSPIDGRYSPAIFCLLNAAIHLYPRSETATFLPRSCVFAGWLRRWGTESLYEALLTKSERRVPKSHL